MEKVKMDAIIIQSLHRACESYLGLSKRIDDYGHDEFYLNLAKETNDVYFKMTGINMHRYSKFIEDLNRTVIVVG